MMKDVFLPEPTFKIVHDESGEEPDRPYPAGLYMAVLSNRFGRKWRSAD